MNISENNLIDANNYITEISNVLKPDYVKDLPSRFSTSKLYFLLRGILLEGFKKISVPNRIIRHISMMLIFSE